MIVAAVFSLSALGAGTWSPHKARAVAVIPAAPLAPISRPLPAQPADVMPIGADRPLSVLERCWEEFATDIEKLKRVVTHTQREMEQMGQIADGKDPASSGQESEEDRAFRKSLLERIRGFFKAVLGHDVIADIEGDVERKRILTTEER